MANHLEQTWLAYAFSEPQGADSLERALGRVERHYGRLYPEPLRREACGDGAIGMALWHRPDPRLRWPLWLAGPERTLASTGALTGRAALTDESNPGVAAAAIAAKVAADPASAAALNPPFVLAVHSAASGSLVIANDVLGTGRLFELRTADGWVWSNRLGALHVFAGEAPRADRRAWLLLAATGWFLGSSTAIDGARQLTAAAAAAITVSPGPDGITIERKRNEALRAALVSPRRARLAESADAAAAAARSLASEVGAVWKTPIDVDLTGGRDSRISAAGAIAAGVDIRITTSDLEHGELDTVRRLLAVAPRRVPSHVEPAESEPPDELSERLAALHLVHDGIRNPQAVLRSPMTIPHGPPEAPRISGHGGEIGHGFYYSSRRELRGLRRGGRDALVERLVRNARKKHGAAREEAYDAYREEVGATLEEGAALGVDGPSLLDWYYLAQRLANRSGLTTSNARWSACSTPQFVRACFDLKPEQRLGSEMHRLVTERLIKAWARAPYFAAAEGPMTAINRPRIWEKPSHSDELGRIIAEDESWHELFDPDVVRRAWEEVRGGGGHQHYEVVFTRIAWRTSFDAHLAVLAKAASA